MSGQIVAFVTFVKVRIAKKNASRRPRRVFTVSGGGEFRIEKASKGSKVMVCGWGTIEMLVGGGAFGSMDAR